MASFFNGNTEEIGMADKSDKFTVMDTPFGKKPVFTGSMSDLMHNSASIPREQESEYTYSASQPFRRWGAAGRHRRCR
jgi:hypothetical protein